MPFKKWSVMSRWILALLLSVPAAAAAQSLTLAGMYGVDAGVNSTAAAFVAVQMDSSRNIYLLLDEGDGVRLLKLNPAGTALLAAAHFGAAGDHGTALALDATGNVYVAGVAGSGAMDVTAGAAQDFPSAQSSFVAKFSPSLGESFLTSTGGTLASVTGIAVQSNAIYVTGNIQGKDLPVTGDGIVLSFPSSSVTTGFVESFNTIGTKLVYASYLGGPNGNTMPTAIAADGSGNMVVTGSDTATGFPTVNGLQPELVGSSDLFLMKLSASAGIEWSTLLGSADGTIAGHAVLLAANGSVIVAANSTTLGLPISNSLMPLPRATSWALVMEFSPDGSSITFSTVLGDGNLNAAAQDASGNIWTAGLIHNLAAWPLTADMQHTGTAFVTGLSPTGNLIYSTRVGGIASSASLSPQSSTAATGIAIASNGSIAVSGTWSALQATSGWLPSALDLPYVNAPNAALRGTLASVVAPASCQTANAPCTAGYVAELSPSAVAEASLSVDTLPNLSLRSLGAAPFSVTSVSASGYAVASDCLASGSLASGGACNIVLTGNGPGTLTAETSAGPFSFPLVGAALSAAQNPIALQPKEAVFTGFGAAASASQTIVASNLTAQPQILSPSGNAEQAASLQQGSCTLTQDGGSYAIPANSTCTLLAVFTDASTQPSQDGPISGFVTTQSGQEPVNAVNFYEYELAESHSPSEAGLVASATAIDFGTQYIGGPMLARTIVLGNATASAVSPAFVATPAADPNFVVTDLCPVTLPAYSSCLIEIVYAAAVTSIDNATLTLPSGASVTLAGTTLPQLGAGGLSVNPSITVFPGTLFFSAVGVGDSTPAEAVSVINSGNVAVAVQIAASPDFKETNNCNGTVAANSSCVVQVAFAPTALGVVHGQLAVTPSGSSPFDVALSGGGVADVNFGAVLLGSGATQWIPLGSFTGNATASIQGPFETAVVNSYTYATPLAIQFSTSSTTSCTSGCYVGVRAIAATGGTQSGTLTLAQQGSGTATYPLTSVELKQPGALLSTYNYSFGTIAVGSSSALKIFTVTNPGNASVSVSSVASSAGFALQNACGSSLAAGASCEIGVAFTPTTIGAATGVLSLNVGGTPLAVQLTGSGANNPADISFSPASLFFLAPSGARTQTITLTNLSNAPRVVSQVAPVGNAFYTLTNNCGTLQPAGISGSSCTLQFTVASINAGPGVTVPVALLVNANGTTYSYSLPVSTIPSALGLGSASLQVTPAALSFPALNVGDVSAPENLIVTNNASTTTAVNVTSPAQFSVDATSCPSLAAGSSCTLPVRFLPSSAGAINNAIFIQGAGAALHVAVAGSGAAATRLASPAYPPLVQPVTSSGITQTLAITNAGTQPLVIQGISGSNLIVGNTCTAPVASHASCAVTVQTLLNCGDDCGSYTADANLTVVSNAESSPDIYSVEQAYASEAGASTMPAFVVSAPSLTFPQTGASESSTLTLQLQSTGAAPLTTAFQTTGDFTETNNCGGELAGYSGAGAYALCTVTLQFIPQATGFRAGTLQIATNAGLQTVTLGGSGPVASGAVPTTTTLLASALSIPAGESETLAVAVIPSSGGVPPTGKVIFYYGNRALGTVAIQSGAAFFTASTRGLPAGSYTVTAQYSGDSTNLASTSAEVTIVVTAGQSATSTSLAASPKTVASGASITLTAIVAKTTGSGQASGAVNFLFGSTLLGSATLSGGTATLTLSSSSFAAGTYSIVADYTGDAADLPSSSAPVTIQIDTNLAATQTVLVATPSTLTQGGQVVLQATVAEVSGSATPTGSIIFAFGSRTLGSSPLFGGIATLTASTGSVPPGNYGIHAIYSGDPANAASASPVVNVTLKAVTATTLSASPTTVAAGQPVNLTATTVETHGSGTPGGSVLFYANGGLLASITVYGGTAIYSAPTSGLPAGSYSNTAYYSGDGLHAPSVSPPVSVTIQ